MTKITRNILSAFFVAVLVLVFSSSIASAANTITTASITASSTSDLRVGNTNSYYKVTFVTTGLTARNASTTIITIVFPVGFSIADNDNLLASSTICNILCDATDAITFNGSDITVTGATSTNSTRTIAFSITSTTLWAEGDTASTTFSFTGATGITNATTSGATATTTIQINPLAVDTPSSTVSGVTLTADDATKLVYRRQASSTTDNGSVISGIVFGQQPVIIAQDQYGNTSTTYSGTVTLTASSTAGGTLGGTASVVAVNGVATTTDLKFTVAAADQETFQILGNQGSLATATSSTYTADVVATVLVFTTQPGNGMTTEPLTTQPVVTAKDADNFVDTDYTSTIALSPTSTTALGSLANGIKAAVLGVATFTSVVYNPSADSETFMLSADDSTLPTVDSNSAIAQFYRGVASGNTYIAPAQTTTATTETTTTTTTPATATTTAPTTTTTETTTPATTAATTGTQTQQQLLDSLIVQLKSLLQQAASLGITLPAGSEAYLASSKLSEMTEDLELDSTGEAVKTLQQFLNAQGFTLASSGAGSSGQETTRFGGLTKAALAKFQSSVGISPAAGYFGPITRAYLKTIGY